MNNLTGQAGELRMSIEIKRAATGEVEKYDLIGKCTEEEAKQLGATMVEKTEKDES